MPSWRRTGPARTRQFRNTKARWRGLAPSLPCQGRIASWCWLPPGYGVGLVGASSAPIWMLCEAIVRHGDGGVKLNEPSSAGGAIFLALNPQPLHGERPAALGRSAPQYCYAASLGRPRVEMTEEINGLLVAVRSSLLQQLSRLFLVPGHADPMEIEHTEVVERVGDPAASS